MKSNTITIVISTIAILGGIYWYFFTGTTDQQPLTTSVSDNRVQTKFQGLVSQLKPISFNSQIFSDPAFMSFIDLSTPITSEPSGRPDPFAPLPGQAVIK